MLTQVHIGGVSCCFPAALLFLRVVSLCLTLCLALTFPPVPETTGVTVFGSNLL